MVIWMRNNAANPGKIADLKSGITLPGVQTYAYSLTQGDFTEKLVFT